MQRISIVWKRLGSIIIDLAIINMFTTIILWFISPLGLLSITNPNMKNNIVWDLIMFILYLLILVLIAYGYQRVLIMKYGRSFGKIFLSIGYVNEKKRKVRNEDLYKREFMKYYLLFGTLGLYGLWVFFKIITSNDYKFYYEKKNNAYIKII